MINYIEECRKRIRSYSERKNASPKKIALKFIFWNIKYIFSHYKNKKSKFKDNIFHIIIHPKGGVGDFVYTAKYVYCLKKKFQEEIEISILIDSNNEAANFLWSNAKYINTIIENENYKNHDCEIEIVRFPIIKQIDKKRFEHIASNELKNYLETISNFYIENPLFFLSDYLGKEYSMLQARSRENQADIENILDMSETNEFNINISENNEVLKKFGLVKDQYIILQTGSGHHFKNENDMRQWPQEYYKELTKKIKSINPFIPVIQIGEAFQKNIEYTDINLIGKTSFNEMLILLKNARLLISQEGGIPILRHFVSQKPSCVFFGPTDKNFYGFKENINISPKISCECEWLTSNWYQKCIKRNSSVSCLWSIKPDNVIEKIRQYLI